MTRVKRDDAPGTTTGARPADAAGKRTGTKPSDAEDKRAEEKPTGTGPNPSNAEGKRGEGKRGEGKPPGAPGKSTGGKPTDPQRKNAGAQPSDAGAKPADVPGAQTGTKPADTRARPADKRGKSAGSQSADAGANPSGAAGEEKRVDVPGTSAVEKPTDARRKSARANPVDAAGENTEGKPADATGKDGGAKASDAEGKDGGAKALDAVGKGGGGGKRADAQRSIAAILRAAAECLSRDPGASTSEIAKAAGVGRVTLYGHFPSRAELVDAVVVSAIELGEERLSTLDLTGDPRDALARLIESSWQLVDQFAALLLAAQDALPPGRVQELHADPMARVEKLLERGRAEGVFRSDLPTSWLVSVMHNVMHGAAGEIHAGRLTSDKAAAYITATLLSAFTPA
ncbi:TetR family transcriptional regulator [Kribbella sp. NPDC026611]|uniref:TetR/AcrR family transcriptional regulator n=1 Tax=Kribbella sp. NPDC026611 TaxID=3154911 RepID=UPI0033CD53E5